MAASRSSVLAWTALAAAVGFLAVALAWRFRAGRAPAAPPPVVAAPAAPLKPVTPSVAAVPLPEPKTPEGKKAVQVASVLSALRSEEQRRRAAATAPTAAEKVDAESRERQAEEDLQRLIEELKGHPESWGDVIAMLGATPDLKIALRLAVAVGPAIDGPAEDRWIAGVQSEQARTRTVSAAALANGKTAGSLNALVAAADRDADAGTRMEAVKSLGHRRPGASPEGAVAIDGALKRRAEQDLDPLIRRTAKNLVSPEPMPGAKRPEPFKRPEPVPAKK